FSQGLTGLSPGATYYACALAESSYGKGQGEVVTFTLGSAGPAVDTEGDTSVDTGAGGETDTDTDASSDEGDDVGCGCATRPGGSGRALVGLVALLALHRRRRA